MLLIPYAHESLSFRRMPYVTIGIITICVVVQVVLSAMGRRANGEASPTDLRLEVADYVLEHPHLEIPGELEEEIFDSFPSAVLRSLELGRAAAARYRANPTYVDAVLEREASPLEDPRKQVLDSVLEAFERSSEGRSEAYRQVARAFTAQLSDPEARLFSHLREIGPEGALLEQQLLNARIAAFLAARATPYEALGAHRSDAWLSHRWLTHIFVHGGWFHLIGNMMFLWLVGFNVEDRWGRVFFTFFYLSAGMVAALTHFSLANDQLADLPLVGASGAIAAVMGVFLVHFSKTKIHVFWWGFFARFGTFEISAYLALPFWFLHQLLLAWLHQDAPTPVAHWAHVGGFAFGLGLAWLLVLTGLEARFLSGRLEREDLVYEYDPEADPTPAEELLSAGRFKEAASEAERILVRAPGRSEAIILRARARAQVGPPDVAQHAVVDALAVFGRRPLVDDVLRFWNEVGPALDRGSLTPAAHLRLARALQAASLPAEAFEELRALLQRHGLRPDTAGAAVALAEMVQAQGKDAQAAAILDKALGIPGLDPVWATRIRALRDRLS